MQRSRSRGFTLIELLVAVALLVILTGVVVFVFSKAVRIFILADARAQIYQNVRAGVDMIRRDLMTSEPLVRSDDVTSNQQRLRIVNDKYMNTKWDTYYPSDRLQIWNLKSTLSDGATGSAYAKYWLDTAANAEVPILKRLTFPVCTTDLSGTGWASTGVTDPVANGNLSNPANVKEELMQYVVGFDVEPYYTNVGSAGAADPHWNLEFDADATANGNYFVDALSAPAKLWIINCDATGNDVFSPAPLSPYTGGAAPFLDITSIQPAGTPFARKAAFATSAPSSLTAPGGIRLVPPLPRAFRITFFVRDEHSNEQRAIQQTIWMPMWGS